MSDQTFEQLWKRLVVHAPDIPIPLAQEFVNTAYSRALGLHDWSALRARSEVFVPAEHSAGTVDVTQGSAALVGSGTAWTADMEGRQFRVAGQPYYTILAVTSATAITLDRPWADETATGQDYTINYVYVRVPEDFGHFLSFADPSNNWRLHTNFLSEDIDRVDAERTSAGTPFVVVSQGVTPAGSATIDPGLQRFELWPRPNGPHLYSFFYMKKLPLMSANADRPIFPLRGDVLRAGAIGELCKWPGTIQTPNPHFNLDLQAIYERDFIRELDRCDREDQEISATNISYDDPFGGMIFAPLDAKFIQSHDIVIA